MNNSFQEIYEKIKNAKNILILTHQKPDADAIGSMLALKLIIERLDILVDVVTTDIPEFTCVIPGYEKILTETNKKYDLTIMVDASSKNQLGAFEYLYDESKELIIIDHHNVEISNETINYIDSSAASTTMIIYQFAKLNNIEIDLNLAICLYAGLITDTGGFAHNNTTSEVFSIAADLLKTGIKHNELYISLIKQEYTLDYLFLEKNVIENLEIINGNIAFSSLNYDTIKKYPFDTPKEFVNLGRYIKGVEVSVLIIEEEPNAFRVSLRSRSYFDVSEIAKKFGGGGHKQASGIRFTGNYDITKCSILNEIIDNIS